MPDTLIAQQPRDEDAILRLVADTAPAMLAYFDADTRACRFANARYAEHFGHTMQTIVGMDVRDIVGELVWTQIEPYLDSVAVDNTQTLRYTRQVENEIGRLQHIEAVLRPHEEKGVLKGIVALMTDVSHHHLATQQIRDSEERMRKFAAITTEAIVLHRDGIITDGNDALARLVGYSLGELRGTPVLDYVAPEARLRALAAHAVVWQIDAVTRLDSVGALAEHTNIAGLQTRRQSIGVVRTIPRGKIENRFSLNYQHEVLIPEGSLRTSRGALTANWSWTHRNVDSVLDPRRGHVFNVQVGGASQALMSDRNFARFYGRYQRFIPAFGRDVVIVRAEGGITAAQSREGVPQDFLFRTGGAQTVRGYAYQSLGVQDGNATVGGRYLAVTSAEYVHWYAGNWGVAAFVDAGNANDERKLFKMNLGYGIGPRWKSPAGPIAVDLAYGQRDHRLRLQFAVAIAF